MGASQCCKQGPEVGGSRDNINIDIDNGDLTGEIDVNREYTPK